MQLVWLLISSVGAAGATFLLQLALSRILGVEDFGYYATINSALTIVGPLGCMGINGLLLRRATVTPELTNSLIAVAKISLFASMFISFFATVTIFSVMGLRATLVTTLSTYYWAFASQTLLMTLSQIYERKQKLAISQSILPSLRLLFVLALSFISQSLDSMVAAIGAANLTAVLICRKISRGFQTKSQLVNGITSIMEFTLKSVPYSLNGAINVAQIQIIVGISATLYGVSSAGIFSAANTVLIAFYLIPNVIFGVYLLPKYHKLSAEGVHSRIPIKHATLAFILGALLAVVVSLLSIQIITILFSNKYLEAAKLLGILCWAIPFRFFSCCIGAAILSERFVVWKVTSSGIALLVQIPLSYLLSKYGIDVAYGNGIHVLSMHGIEAITLGVVFSEIIVAVLYGVVFWVASKKSTQTVSIRCETEREGNASQKGNPRMTEYRVYRRCGRSGGRRRHHKPLNRA